VYLVEHRDIIENALLMFQKEFADRLLAAPGKKSYGRMTVLISYCGTVQTIAQIPAAAFYPKPKVDSTVIQIRFFDPPPIQASDEQFFFRVVRAAFGKRRKMLKNALKSSDLKPDDVSLSKAFELSAIAPSRRAETLSIEEFVRLSEHLKSTLTH
jgi:16S rRNA (adenine1518-N6/adenine1519-N6)-dimethyltransferase